MKKNERIDKVTLLIAGVVLVIFILMVIFQSKTSPIFEVDFQDDRPEEEQSFDHDLIEEIEMPADLNQVFDLAKIEQKCKSSGGKYLAEYQECEYLDENTCLSLGGRFYDCGSACRHVQDPNTACILMCVPYCAW